MAAMRAELVAETENIRAERRAIEARTEATLARMDAKHEILPSQDGGQA
jgi:hypothetical protein